MRWMLLLILLVPALSGADAAFTFANDRLAVTVPDKPAGILVVEKGSKLVADGQTIMKLNGTYVISEDKKELMITDDVIKAAADDKTGFDLIEESKTNKHDHGYTQEDVDDYLADAAELGVAGSFVVTHGHYLIIDDKVVDLAHLDSARYTAYFLTEIAKSDGCLILYMKVKLIR